MLLVCFLFFRLRAINLTAGMISTVVGSGGSAPAGRHRLKLMSSDDDSTLHGDISTTGNGEISTIRGNVEPPLAHDDLHEFNALLLESGLRKPLTVSIGVSTDSLSALLASPRGVTVHPTTGRLLFMTNALDDITMSYITMLLYIMYNYAVHTLAMSVIIIILS